jgi:hypothetical protein
LTESKGNDDDQASAPRELMRLLRHHPRHLPERLVVFAASRLGEPTRVWAAQRLKDGVDPREESNRLKHQTVVLSRLDGAVAGTPFFVAIVPAYVAFLWAQMRLALRIAALHGRDPTDPRLPAELLALRGVYPSVEEAEVALANIDTEAPESGRRDRVVAWAFLVRRILILAAFNSASNPDEHTGRLRLAASVVVGVAIWAVTWAFPLTFMILMSWSCESSSRQLGSVALEYFSGRGDETRMTRKGLQRLRIRPDPGHNLRRIVRWVLLAVSVGLPIVLLATSVTHKGQHVEWLRVAAPLVGLSLVLIVAAKLRD